MPRRVQDILPADRRSIRNVPLDEAPKPKTKANKRSKTREENEDGSAELDREIPVHKVREPMRHMPVTPPTPPTKRKGKRGKWFVITLSIIVLIGIAGYVASTYYSRATFTITPKVIPVSVNGTYVAQSTPGANVLNYELVTVKGAASTTVPAIDGAQTNTKATGKITVYNAYSAQTLRLIAGTRFSDDSGRIYRLTNSIVIPGYTKPATNIIPGSIVTTIVADEAGQSYNISKTDAISDFKVVAYKGGDKYDSVYGRLASDVSGGFTGVKKVVNPTAVASSSDVLKANLTRSLLAQAKAAIPDGYIMYDNGYKTVFTSPSIDNANVGKATVAIQGTLYGILFKKVDISKTFAGAPSVASFGNFGYNALGLDTIQVSVTNLKDFSPEKRGTVIIHAKGNMKLVGTIPVDEIKHKLAGIPLGSTENVFKSYSPVIENGSGELVPPWAKIPNDLERITVTVAEP
jgi:hypothetical protein